MRRVLALSLVCWFFAAGVVRSTTVIAPTFGSLVSKASTIFVGDVMDVRSVWEDTRDGRSIITLVTFRVSDVWKGSVGAVTQLEFLGGTIGETTMVVAGVPRFSVGQRDVLFVGGTARAISPLVAMMHGRMRVDRDTNGVERVTTFDGRAVVSTAELGPQRAASAPAGGPPMRLVDLGAAVRAELQRR